MSAIQLLTYDGKKSTAAKLGFPVQGTPLYVDECRDKVVVRWGNTHPSYNTNGLRAEYAKVMNPRAAILANVQKHRATERMCRAVRTPQLFAYTVPDGVKAVVRPFEHIAGAEFKVVDGPYDIPPGYYATEFLKTDLECRVWFCGRYTLTGKRARHADRSECPCRSGWGYEFRHDSVTHVPHRFDPSIASQTLKAAKALGLDMGAADVLWYHNEPVFLELNTAPSIDHARVEAFFRVHIPLAAAEKYGE